MACYSTKGQHRCDLSINTLCSINVRLDTDTSIPQTSTVGISQHIIYRVNVYVTGTEAAVAEAIESSGVPREEIFITTKLKYVSLNC